MGRKCHHKDIDIATFNASSVRKAGWGKLIVDTPSVLTGVCKKCKQEIEEVCVLAIMDKDALTN